LIVKTIRFSVDDEQYQILILDAAAKGLTIAQYAKSATFAHVSKYPSRGVMRELSELRQKTP